jgi:hypothetical protein
MIVFPKNCRSVTIVCIYSWDVAFDSYVCHLRQALQSNSGGPSILGSFLSPLCSPQKNWRRQFSDLEKFIDFTATWERFVGTLPLLSTFLDEPFNPVLCARKPALLERVLTSSRAYHPAQSGGCAMIHSSASNRARAFDRAFD